MKGGKTDASASLNTLTHARLRASQGDLRGARVILERILDRQPEHGGARRMRRELDGRVEKVRQEERDETPPPARAADPRDLAARFRGALGAPSDGDRRGRIERLQRLLGNIDRNSGERK